MAQHTPYYLSRLIGNHLRKLGLTLAVAESCTGGGLSSTITSVAGSSAWFRGGVVVYNDALKQNLTGVKEATLKQYTAISKEAVMEMSHGVIERTQADVAISVSGEAGPHLAEHTSRIGDVWFSLAHRDGACECRLHSFTSGRDRVRMDAIYFALTWMEQHFSALLHSDLCPNQEPSIGADIH